MVHTLRLDNYSTTPRKLVLGTNSSYGTESIKIERGAGWDGLNLTATWHIPGREEPLRVALLDGDAMDVPPEVTKEAKDGVLVLAGLASGVQRASCNMEYLILEQAGVYGGTDAEPTPELAAQVLEATMQAKANAEAAAQDASEAKANANKAQQAAENAAADAAKAASAAKKAADESVAANIAAIEKMQANVASKQTATAASEKAAAASAVAAAGSATQAETLQAAAAQAAEIAQAAAGSLQPEVNQIKDDLSALAPAGAQVGQLFRVAAVSEDEKYTMEPVDMPSDWGMRTIADITLEENVAQCIFSADADGNSLDLHEVIVYGNLIKTVTNCYTRLKISDGINEHTLNLGRYNGSESVIWHVILADDGSLFYTIQNSENRFYYSIYKSALSCITNITVLVNGSTNAVMETGSRIAIIGR